MLAFKVPQLYTLLSVTTNLPSKLTDPFTLKKYWYADFLFIMFFWIMHSDFSLNVTFDSTWTRWVSPLLPSTISRALSLTFTVPTKAKNKVVLYVLFIKLTVDLKVAVESAAKSIL